MSVFAGEKSPLPTLLGETGVDVLDLGAGRDWPFSGHTISQQVLTFPHLIINRIIVPPGDAALFQVAATYEGSQFNGEMTCDFNSDDWNISNNFLTLNIWYPVVSING